MWTYVVHVISHVYNVSTFQCKRECVLWGLFLLVELFFSVIPNHRVTEFLPFSTKMWCCEMFKKKKRNHHFIHGNHIVPQCYARPSLHLLLLLNCSQMSLFFSVAWNVCSVELRSGHWPQSSPALLCHHNLINSKPTLSKYLSTRLYIPRCVI